MAFPSKTAFPVTKEVAKENSNLPDSPPREISLVSVSCVVCGASEAEAASQGYDYEYGSVPNLFAFVRCVRCGHLYLNPRPSPIDLGVIYPPNYYAFAENQSGNPTAGFFRKIWEAQKVRSFRKIVGPGKKRILDVGCGEGRFLSILREFGSPEWELIGVDFDAEAVRRCRNRGFRTHVARVEDLAPDEKFDVVIMFQLIEHVEDPVAIARKVRSLLNPGGLFIVETPHPVGLDYHWFKKSYWGHYHFPRHWNLFTRENLRKILTRNGFAIVQEASLLAPACWIVSLHNFVLDKHGPPFLVRFFHFQNPILLALFVIWDLVRKGMGFPTSNQRMVGQVLE